MLCHVSFWLVFLGVTICRWSCQNCWFPRGTCQEVLDMEKNMEQKGLRLNVVKRKVMICGTGLDLLQSSGDTHALSVVQEYATTASTAMAANFGCIRNAAGYNDWHQILTICVHGAWGMPALLLADHRLKSRVDLISWRWMLLLPDWHAFCWWRQWNNGRYSCEISLEEVQGATTSSHIPQPLLQDSWPCIQHLCAERYAPCQFRLGHWPKRTCSACSAMIWTWSDRSAVSSQRMWSR